MCLRGAFASASEDPRIYDVRKFGAHGDGKSLDTVAIQSAIDAAADAGGGVVLLAPGVYLSGSLRLKSRIELRIQANATLLGSSSRSDYQKGRWFALLLAAQQEGITISGGGTIDGQGRALAKDVARRMDSGELKKSFRKPNLPVESERPLLIEFSDCRHVRISGITLRNAACWVENYIRCADLVINGIKVDSNAYYNNDGIDISDCQGVKISGCDVDSEDDGICLKSESAGNGCRDVDISDCRIRSNASALKLGTASRGGFHKIRATNLTIFDTAHSAIALESVDGGTLDDVTVEHVRAVNTENAIFLRLGHRNPDADFGRLENVLIRDVHVEVSAGKAGRASTPRSAIPSSIVGLPGHPVGNVRLEDIEIVYPGAGNADIARGPRGDHQSVPENPAGYPEFSMFGELPAWGFYIRHADGVTIRNLRIKFKQPDARPAFVFDDAANLRLEKTIVQSASHEPVMVLQAVRDAAFDVEFPSGYGEVEQSANCQRITGLPVESSKTVGH